MDPIETGPGEVERDAASFAKHAETPMGGPARHLARGINRVSDRGDGHDAAIRGLAERIDQQDRAALGEAKLTERALARIVERVAELERIVSAHGPRLSAVVSRTEGIPQLRHEVSELGAEVLRIADELRERIGGLELEVFPVLRGGEVRDSGGGSHRFPAFVRYTPEPGLVTPGLTSERVYRVLGRDTRFLRLEGDDGKPVEIAPRFLVAVPGPASTADLDQRDRQPIPLSAVRCTCGDATRPGIHRFGGAPCYREGVPPDFLRVALLRRSPWAAYDRTPEVLAEVAAVLPPDEARMVLQAGEPSGGVA